VPSDMAARVKAAINLQGRRVGNPRRPLLPVSAEVRAELAAALEISGEVTAAVSA
jgi:dihydrodipicolinate synthase/N-acetylneuraminate lyase